MHWQLTLRPNWYYKRKQFKTTKNSDSIVSFSFIFSFFLFSFLFIQQCLFIVDNCQLCQYLHRTQVIWLLNRRKEKAAITSIFTICIVHQYSFVIAFLFNFPVFKQTKKLRSEMPKSKRGDWPVKQINIMEKNPIN